MGSIGIKRGASVRLGTAVASAALLIALTGAFAGCGSDDNSSSSANAAEQSSQPDAGGSPREQVRATANAYLTALDEADGPKACAQLTEPAKESFVSQASESASESKSCEDAVHRYSELYLANQLTNPRVTKVRAVGSTGAAEWPDDVPLIPHVLDLVKEGNRWLIVNPVDALRQSRAR
jgi:hypothetical protein